MPPTTTSADEPQSQGRRRSRKGEGARLRDEILEAAGKLLLEKGSAEAVSIRAVADAVGVTAPSIYRHFPDKQTLIYEVSEQPFTELHEHLQAAVAGIDDPSERLSARGRAYVDFGRTHPEPYRIMFMSRPEMVPIERQMEWFRGSATFLDTVADVQACIDAELMRPELTDAFMVTLGIWARVHGLTSLVISKPFLPIDDDFITQYIEDCYLGVHR